jgi:hypothetical protein
MVQVISGTKIVGPFKTNSTQLRQWSNPAHETSGQILWYNNFYFYPYFGNLDILNVIFIFLTALSVLSMDRYEKVTLERNNNRWDRVKISVLANEWRNFVRKRLTSAVRETYMFASRRCRETELKKEEEFKQCEEALKNGKKNWVYRRNN